MLDANHSRPVGQHGNESHGNNQQIDGREGTTLADAAQDTAQSGEDYPFGALHQTGLTADA